MWKRYLFANVVTYTYVLMVVLFKFMDTHTKVMDIYIKVMDIHIKVTALLEYLDIMSDLNPLMEI